MTTATQVQNILVRDPDGHYYSIPETDKPSFIRLTEEIQNADWGTDEWHRANDDLNDTFGACMRD